MDITHYIKEIGRGAKGARDLSQQDAQTLFSAILDGQVDELQLGALLIGLRIKSESNDEMLGFKAALDARTPHLQLRSDLPKLISIPSYNGARRQPNLTPLLALSLAQQGIPVLIHGRYDFETRVNPSDLMDALNIPRARDLQHASNLLNEQRIAFIDLANYLPGLDALLALRPRLGLRNCGHTMVKLLDPLPGRSVRLVAVTHPEYLEKMHAFLQADQACAMLLRGTEGEVYANPRRRPQLEIFRDGQAHIAYPAEEGGAPPLDGLPMTPDNQTSATLIRNMLDNPNSIPMPIRNQIDAIKLLSS